MHAQITKKAPRQKLPFENKANTHMTRYCDVDWVRSPKEI